MIQINIKKKLLAAGGEMNLKLDLFIEKGSFVSLFGKSGAGKTSTLRILAGLMESDSGKIEVHGHTWFDSEKGINLRPQERKVGMLFQEYSLFPNMTVRENLVFALARDQDVKAVDELIKVVELEKLQDRQPETLSGGQKQRVALARALVQKPELLMLDEPLSALDGEMRQKLQHFILQVHREYGITTLMISHDMSEILRMSDVVYEMESGKIVRKGKPIELFNPRHLSGKFRFIGEIYEMKSQDFVVIITVLVENELVKVIIEESEARTLSVGDKVIIASKAFNPIVRKI